MILKSPASTKNCWHSWENTTQNVLEPKLPDVTLVSYLIPFEWLSACLFLESYFCGKVIISQSFLNTSVLVINIWKACCQNIYRTFDNDLYSIYASIYIFPYCLLYIIYIYIIYPHTYFIYIYHIYNTYFPYFIHIVRIYMYIYHVYIY